MSATGSGGSPSIQVKEDDIEKGIQSGFHRIEKTAKFGTASVVTMSPNMLPNYLDQHASILSGQLSAHEIQIKSMTDMHNNQDPVEFCGSRGFTFDPETIARYVAAISTKPFLILAGVSGTGKSKLAELIGEYYSAHTSQPAENSDDTETGESFVFEAIQAGSEVGSRVALVPVRPDWIDNQSILGYFNPISMTYEGTSALSAILQAKADLDSSQNILAAPRHFLLLDEMNLARVEHYFSDWMACSESRRLVNSCVVQQPVPLHQAKGKVEISLNAPDGSTATASVPQALELPTNLIVTGTVNVDETTYSFSPKVLDRAFVLEFDDVDLNAFRTKGSENSDHDFKFPKSLPDFQLASAIDYQTISQDAHELLLQINSILEPVRMHLGYRAASEIALFLKNYTALTKQPEDPTNMMRGLDAAVLMKVLPRLSGSRSQLEEPLSRLCRLFKSLDGSVSLDGQVEFDASDPAKLPNSYSRAVQMLNTVRSTGFVSFFH